MAGVISDLGDEDTKAKLMVYLCTVSRVLQGIMAQTGLQDITGMTREQVGSCVRRSFDNPLPPEAGQPGREAACRGRGEEACGFQGSLRRR